MPNARSGPVRIRLAYVAHTLNPGGTERLAVDMAIAFAARLDVQMICLDEPGLWAGELRAAGIPVHCVWRQPGFDPAVAGRLARLFRRLRADLVHAHQCTPWFYAALSRLLYRRPRLLLEEHGRFHPEQRKSLRIHINRVLVRRLTHGFVAVSGDIRDRLAQFEGLMPRDIRVVYNGVRPLAALTGAERASIRAALGIGPEEFVIGTVGRLDPIKNLPLLLHAFSRLRRTHTGLRLVIVGEGPERGRLEQLIGELGLTGQVLLTGFRADARRLLATFDVFTMTSFSEGTSMALLEAMSAALPVAVSAVGGNPEIVEDDTNGLLFSSNDCTGLTRALLRLNSEPALRQRLGAAARSSFDRRFSLDAMIGYYSAIYDELLGVAT